MTTIADVDSFGIVLPDSWVGLPLEQEPFDRFCAELSARWRSEPDWERSTERRADVLLQRVRGELTRHGATFAAALFDNAVPDGKPLTEENVEPLMAVCTFGVYTRNDFDSELGLTLAVLYAAFARRADPETRFGRVTNVEPPSLFELNIGRVVRLQRVYKPKGFGANTTEPFYAESFIAPLGDDGEAAGVLQFATTNIDIAHQFSALFVAIAKTMTLFTPDQPTVLNGPGSTEPRPREPRPRDMDNSNG